MLVVQRPHDDRSVGSDIGPDDFTIRSCER